MFARNISIHLKANSSVAFTKLIEDETIPTLRKQEGFQGELTLVAPGGAEAVGISLWDKKENADAYARDSYPEVMKSLNKFVISHIPQSVHIVNVTNSVVREDILDVCFALFVLCFYLFVLLIVVLAIVHDSERRLK